MAVQGTKSCSCTGGIWIFRKINFEIGRGVSNVEEKKSGAEWDKVA
jgi:hypothetical protein